jgi:hypothetical protein
MKKIAMMVVVMVVLMMASAGGRAQGGVIGIVISKVVRALDLHVQALQTETILLQNAEAVLQNTMSELRLDEIEGWLTDQKDLYAGYFQELAAVKTVVGDYHRIAEIVERQKAIVSMYQRGISLVRSGGRFTAAEVDQITGLFGNILAESERNLQQLLIVLEAGATSMTDEQRLAAIDAAGSGIAADWKATLLLTDETELMALQRARDINDYETLKKLYGL